MSNSLSSEAPAESMGKEDIIDFLGQEDELLSDSKKDLLADDKEDEEPVKTKKDEKEDEELELADENDQEPDLDELVTPHAKKEILAKYPKIFKDFPYLEKAYYREQEYTKLLPTIEDAKEVVDRAQTLEKFETALFGGSTEEILKSVKEADEKAYGKIVDNYLPTLQKVDQNAYFHVIGTVIKSTIAGMAREADNIKNDHLRNAALILNQFVFGSSSFVPANNFSGQEDPKITEESNRLKSEREQFVQQRLDATVGTLSETVNNRIKSTIAMNIDPKDTMSPYVKKTAIKDAMSFLDEQVSQDSRYQAIKDGLWKKAIQSNFSRESISAIEKAHISKVKTLLRDVIAKTRNEALKGSDSKRNSNDDRDKKGPLPVGRTAGQSTRDSGDKNKVPRGMKTLDFLNSD